MKGFSIPSQPRIPSSNQLPTPASKPATLAFTRSPPRTTLQQSPLIQSFNYHQSSQQQQNYHQETPYLNSSLEKSQVSLFSEKTICKPEISKIKRNTLPSQLQKQQSSSIFSALSPTRTGTNIRFTYCRSQKQIPQNDYTSPVRIPVAAFFSPKPVLQTSPNPKIFKSLKCKLCSKEFQLNYTPLQEFRRKNRQLERWLQQLKKQSDLLTSKTYSECDRARESQLTADETTLSTLNRAQESLSNIKDSGLSLDNCKMTCQTHQKLFKETIQRERVSLLDQLPSSKKLGKTIMLKSGYDFGGLLGDDSGPASTSPTFKLKSEGRQSWKEWTQLRQLLIDQSPSDLKASIHCSPDIRQNPWGNSALRGFGRQITESIMSFKE